MLENEASHYLRTFSLSSDIYLFSLCVKLNVYLLEVLDIKLCPSKFYL